MPFFIPKSLIFLLITMLTATTCQSDEIQSLAEIRQAVNNFLAAQHQQKSRPAEIEVGQIDSRLRFTPCEQALDTFMPSGSKARGNTTVGVRCHQPEPWTLYVRAKIRVFEQVVVATRNFSRGEILSAAHVGIEERDLSGVHQGYFTTLEDVLGQVSGRSINSGTILTPHQIKPAILVNRGDPVTIRAGNTAFVARMKGRALSDGTSGQTIRVKNLASQRIIQGTVIGPGLVEVRL